MKIKLKLLCMFFICFSIVQVYVAPPVAVKNKMTNYQSQCCCIGKACNCNELPTGGCKTIDNPSNNSI